MKKIKQTMLTVVSLLAIAILVGFGGIDAKAASITQSNQNETSITINWARDKYITGKYYYLGYGTDSKAAREMANSKAIAIPVSTTSYTLTNLAPGTAYYVYLNYEYGRNKNISYNSGTVKTLPGVVTGLNQDEWYRLALKVHISWDKQPGVDGYEYRFMDHKGNDIDHQNKSAYSTTIDEDIKNDKVYTGTVRAYTTINGVTYFSDWCPTAYFMTQPAKKGGRFEYRELDAKVSGNALKVSWAKVDGLDGYNVYVATKRGGSFKKVKSLKSSKKSITIKKIGKQKVKNNKTYYVYVEGIKNVGGRTYTTGLNYITQVKHKKVSVIYNYSWK